MVFFSQKILRKLTGNLTFLIITDREDLDGQIYKNFAYAGAVTEPEKDVRANSAEHLKLLLQEDHRYVYVFTLIQKFRIEKGQNLDWRKRQQTKAGVEVAIKDILDLLPETYSAELYELKCQEVFQHIYEFYSGKERSIYNTN